MNDTFQTINANVTQQKFKRSIESVDIQHLTYCPRAPYQFDMEVFSMGELRRRISKVKARSTHLYEFYTLVCITRGSCTHMIDFKPIHCGVGSLLVIRPGQAHNYGHHEGWDGWNILFRPEFVLPISTIHHELKLAFDLEKLPEHISLDSNDLLIIIDSIEQMHQDMQLNAPFNVVQALLRYQFYALLTRLFILPKNMQGAQEAVISPAFQRFKRFQQLVEERFTVWHRVLDYAIQLGYTEKSLTRAVENVLGMTAKAFLTARVSLEAKRMLVHTDLTIIAIAEKLGFEEATNFSKFFKREVSCTPTEFRQRQREAF